MAKIQAQQIDDREYLSQQGYKDLQQRLKLLKTVRRMEIAEHLEYAKGLGDLSENAEYAEAKDEQMVNEAEIRKLEQLLSRAQIIEAAKSDHIRVGSTVTFKRSGAIESNLTIVGKEEADPINGKISNESPLGRAFLGRKENEKILVTTPKGEVEYHIIDIA